MSMFSWIFKTTVETKQEESAPVTEPHLTKEQYLAMRAAWKKSYMELTAEIKAVKAQIRNGKPWLHHPYALVSKRLSLRNKAYTEMITLKEMKKRANEAYLALQISKVA